MFKKQLRQNDKYKIVRSLLNQVKSFKGSRITESGLAQWARPVVAPCKQVGQRDQHISTAHAQCTWPTLIVIFNSELVVQCQCCCNQNVFWICSKRTLLKNWWLLSCIVELPRRPQNKAGSIGVKSGIRLYSSKELMSAQSKANSGGKKTTKFQRVSKYSQTIHVFVQILIYLFLFFGLGRQWSFSDAFGWVGG